MATYPFARERLTIVQGRNGFTIVELVLIMAIIGVLAIMAIPSYSHITEKAKTSRCIAEIRALEKDITAYFIDNGVYPSSLNDIGRGDLKDPWKRPYHFVNLAAAGAIPYEDIIAAPLNTDFDLYSSGPDGASTQSLTAGNPTCEDDIKIGRAHV